MYGTLTANSDRTIPRVAYRGKYLFEKHQVGAVSDGFAPYFMDLLQLATLRRKRDRPLDILLRGVNVLFDGVSPRERKLPCHRRARRKQLCVCLGAVDKHLGDIPAPSYDKIVSHSYANQVLQKRIQRRLVGKSTSD